MSGVPSLPSGRCQPRAVLHALRDRIGPIHTAQLGAQLPMLVRGLYYEGWRANAAPTHERHREAFLAHVAQG